MADVVISGTCSFNMTIHSPQDTKAGVYVTSTLDNITTKGKAPMAYTLPTDKKIAVQISYVDSKGNPAQVDGAVNWSSSDTNIVTVNVPDGNDTTKAEIIPAADLGQAQITATADADLGAGVQNIITPFDVMVVAGSAVAGTITPSGDPVPITDSTRRKHATK